MKRGPKCVFLFFLRSSVPPLITVSFKKKTFQERDFSCNFFSEVYFFTAFLSNPFDNFFRTIKKTFFLKIILYNQKKVLGKLFFFFQYWHSRLPLITKLLKTRFWKNTYCRFFLQSFFLSLSSCVCTPIDESYQTNQNFLRETNFTENMLSPKNIVSFLPSVLCTPHWWKCRSKNSWKHIS